MMRLRDGGKSSMFYWWDKVKNLGIPVPKTVMIKWNGRMDELIGLIDRKKSSTMDAFVAEIESAAEKFGYPVFLRSDEASNKHQWVKSCYIESKEMIRPNLANIAEMCLMVGLDFDGVAVREFLELDWKFKSHNGMPVASERRYFVRDGVVECWHPYWAPGSIRHPTEGNWQELLKELQTPKDGEVELLTTHAEKIGKAIGEYWSVDFCLGKNGTWYLTDMAMGHVSYHWGTCPNAPSTSLLQYGDPEKIPEPEEVPDWMKELMGE